MGDKDKGEDDISRNTSIVDLQTVTSSTVTLTDCNKGSKTNGIPTAYDPFDNREKKHVTTDLGALIHLFKASLGTGILAVPRAFKNSGLLMGIIGTFTIGFVCTHCVAILVKCSHTLSVRIQKPSLGFAETAEVSFKTGPKPVVKFAPLAREFVTLALFSTYYFGSTVYIVLVALSFKQVLDNHLNMDLNIRWYILSLTVVLIPLSIWRQLKFLVPFSAIGTVFIVMGLLSTFYYIFSDLPPVNSRKYFDSVENLPQFFSTILFAMEGIGTVLPIENSMEHPQHFLRPFGVLNISMTLVVLLYAFLGFFGYLKYGDEIKGSITLNLPEDMYSETVKILVALSVLFTYGLQFCVPSEVVWSRLKPYVSAKYENTAYYTMRGLLILGTVFTGILIPDLAPFIALIGSICFSMLGLLVPAVIEMITYWEEDVSMWLYVKNGIIMMLALIALVSGSYSSIQDILEIYR